MQKMVKKCKYERETIKFNLTRVQTTNNLNHINQVLTSTEKVGYMSDNRLVEQQSDAVHQNEEELPRNPIKMLLLAQALVEKRQLSLTKLYKRLCEKLNENHREQNQIRKTILSRNEAQVKKKVIEPNYKKPFFIKFGIPYFVDKFHFSPPPNKDHHTKIERDELIISSLPRYYAWRKADRDKLHEAIRQSLIKEHSKKLSKKILQLKKILFVSSKNKYKSLILKNIARLQNLLKSVKSYSLIDLVTQEDEDRAYNWNMFSQSLFKGRHSPEECCSYWNVYLKPTVNKKAWTRAEDKKLLDIAEKMEFQDWDSIANLLGSNRSAFQCIVHYQTRLASNTITSKGRWSREEDKQLLSIMENIEPGDYISWTDISSRMDNIRNKNQIYNRWLSSLDPKLVKGKFSKDEDVLIVLGIEVFGVNYKELSSLMTYRSASQIRQRYERYLNPKTVRKGLWSLEEDEKLLMLVQKYGDHDWASISEKMKTRSRTQMRRRYCFIQGMIRSKPGWDIYDVKRNQHIADSKAMKRIKMEVEKFKKEIADTEARLTLSKTERSSYRIEKLKEMSNNILIKKQRSQAEKNKLCASSGANCKRLNDPSQKIVENNQRTESKMNEVAGSSVTNNGQLQGLLSNKIILKKRFPVGKINMIFAGPIDCSLIKHFAPYRQSSLRQKHSKPYRKEYNDKFNELLLMAQHFGYKLCFPQIKNEVKENPRLDNQLKHLLYRTVYNTLIKATSSDNSSSIDYVAPDIDDTLIMREWWYMPPYDVTRLNFNECFKHTVFDYSCGVHKDIWTAKIKRSTTTNSTRNNNKQIKSHIPETVFYIPPNVQNILGFRSLLLSRCNLKKDYCENGLVEGCSERNYNVKHITADLDENIQLEIQRFYKTMAVLFMFPNILSKTSIDLTSVVKSKHKKRINKLLIRSKVSIQTNNTSPNKCTVNGIPLRKKEKTPHMDTVEKPEHNYNKNKTECLLRKNIRKEKKEKNIIVRDNKRSKNPLNNKHKLKVNLNSNQLIKSEEGFVFNDSVLKSTKITYGNRQQRRKVTQ